MPAAEIGTARGRLAGGGGNAGSGASIKNASDNGESVRPDGGKLACYPRTPWRGFGGGMAPASSQQQQLSEFLGEFNCSEIPNGSMIRKLRIVHRQKGEAT